MKLTRAAIVLIAVAPVILAGCADDPDQADFKTAFDATGMDIDWTQLDPVQGTEWLLRGDVHGAAGTQLRFFVWREKNGNFADDPLPVDSLADELNLSFLGVEDFGFAAQDAPRPSDPRISLSRRLEEAFCAELIGDTCGP